MAEVKETTRYGEYMTGNSAPTPYTATASMSTWGAFRAFSQSLTDDISLTGCKTGTEQWVQIRLDQAIRIWAFKVYVRTTVSNQDAGTMPYHYSLLGSADGTTFETIYSTDAALPDDFGVYNTTVAGKYDWANPRLIEVQTQKEYQYYRLSFAECQAVNQGSVTSTTADNVKVTLLDLFRVTGEPEPSVIPVTGVSLSETAVSLLTEESVRLTATIEPAEATEQGVSWKTNHAAVATVTDGLVTAIAAGEAVITVTTVDGGFTAECVVTVTEPRPELDTGILQGIPIGMAVMLDLIRRMNDDGI